MYRLLPCPHRSGRIVHGWPLCLAPLAVPARRLARRSPGLRAIWLGPRRRAASATILNRRLCSSPYTQLITVRTSVLPDVQRAGAASKACATVTSETIDIATSQSTASDAITAIVPLSVHIQAVQRQKSPPSQRRNKRDPLGAAYNYTRCLVVICSPSPCHPVLAITRLHTIVGAHIHGAQSPASNSQREACCAG